MAKICLTGTSGGLGSRVLYHLLNTLHVSPQDLIVSLYNPSKAPEELKKLGVEVRRGDYNSPYSLRASFQGADRLFLVSYPSPAHDPRVAAHVNAIEAANAVGIKHIYYTSLAFGDASDAAVMSAHIETQDFMARVCPLFGMTYTLIKEGIYSESFPLYLNFLAFTAPASERVSVLPLNPVGGVAWVTRDDLGEATARIMLEDPESPEWKNRRVLLSGSESWTLNQLTSCISKLLGWQDEPLRIKAVGDEAWIDHQAKSETGSKEHPHAREFAHLWVSTYPAIDKGETAVVDPLCERLLGRKPVGMEDYLRGFLKDQIEKTGAM